MILAVSHPIFTDKLAVFKVQKFAAFLLLQKGRQEEALFGEDGQDGQYIEYT